MAAPVQPVPLAAKTPSAVIPPEQRAPRTTTIVPHLMRAAGSTDQLQIRISELPAATEMSETDEFEVNQSGTSRKATLELITEAVAPDLRPFLTGLVGGAGILAVGNAPVMTVSLAMVGVPDIYGDETHIPKITVDQFGRVNHVELVRIAQPDVTGFAPLESPAFSGTPTVPTASPGTSTTQIASAAFVQQAITSRNLAPLASPAFTGSPTAPTPALDAANTALLATIGFVRTTIEQSSAAIEVGDTAPVAPRSNQLWWHNVFGQLFLYYDDGDSQQWVPASPAVSNVEIPPGTMVDFGGVTAPQGWYLCDGALKNRVSDARLFNAIGTRYGAGDGSTTFAVPNLRKRVTAMIDPDAPGWEEIGTEMGEATHALTAAEMPSHIHTVPSSAGRTVSQMTPNSFAYLEQTAGAFPVALTGDMDTAGSGGNAAHNNIQPTLLVNKIIKR